MTPLLTLNLLRALFLTFCVAIGGIVTVETQGSAIPGILIGALFALVLVLVDRLLKGFSLRAFSSATFGLLLGLLFANLLMGSQILRFQSETTQWAVRLVVYCAFAYLGMMLAMRSSRDEFSLIIPYVRFARETTQREPLVVDTNVIIDGRIADLCATGFLSRSLIVPAIRPERIANAGGLARSDQARARPPRPRDLESAPAFVRHRADHPRHNG